MPSIHTFMGSQVSYFFEPDTFAPENTPSTLCIYLPFKDESSHDLSFEELWQALLQEIDPHKVRHLIIGIWDYDEEVDTTDIIDLIASDAHLFSHLEGLFFGDIDPDELNISWIVQGDVGTLLNAFPSLTYFGVRGGQDLSFASCSSHTHLNTLIIESGGLEASVLQDITSMDLSNLSYLELWSGDSEFGFDGDTQAYNDFITRLPERFPSLKELALKNSEIADELARFLAQSQLITQLDTLDLSMGTLSDAGLHILMEADLQSIKTLDISRNYIENADLVSSMKDRIPRVIFDHQKREDAYGTHVDVGE